MATIYDVDAMELINLAVEELKKIDSIKAPEWAIFVKTGSHRERPPIREDWWFVRAAAILRKIYKFAPVGTNTLRRVFGGRTNRGHKPDAVRRAGGSIIRKILQQLESAELIKKEQKGVHKGRVITPKGKSLLDKLASQIYKETKKQKKIDAEIEKEEAARLATAKAEAVKAAEAKSEEVKKDAPSVQINKPHHQEVKQKTEVKKEEPKVEVKQENKEKPTEAENKEKPTEAENKEKPANAENKEMPTNAGKPEVKE